VKVAAPVRRYRFGPFEIGTDEPVLRRDGELVALPRRAASLLLVLLDRPGRVVPKDELLRVVWPDATVGDNNLNQAVAALRKALGDGAESPRFLDTIPRVGYRFLGPVEVVEPGAAAAVEPRSAGETRAAPAVAVLPFETRGPTPDEAALAEGLVEALTAALARQRRLVVRAGGAVRRLLGAGAADPVEAGRALDVDLVVDGRLRPSAGGFALALEVVRVADGGVAWATRSELVATALPVLADELAARITSVAVGGPADESRRVRSTVPHGMAYPLYLQGRHYANLLTPHGYEVSRVCFEKALAEDATFALASSGLAYLYLQVADILLPPGEAMTRARRAAEHALRLDPALAEAHACLGTVRYMHDWDAASAEESFRAASASREWAPGARRLHGWFLAFLGRFDEAFALFDEADRADPISLDRHLYETPACWLSRRWEQGLEASEAFLRLFPELWLAHVLRGRILEGLGEGKRALAAFEAAAARPDAADEVLGDLGRRRALERDRRGAEAVLEELGRRATRRNVASFHRAQVLVGLGDRDGCFEALDAALAERSWYLVWLKVAPFLDPVRDDPRFGRLLDAVGLWGHGQG